MGVSSSSVSISPSAPPPLHAWIAISGLTIFSAVAVLAGAGSVLRLLFPLGSLVVGLFLYGKYPTIYIGFMWWLWFITPGLRRLIDYRSGWDGSGIILTAPFLVTLITLISLIKYLPQSYRMGGFPLVMSFLAVFYGFLIGLVNNPIAISLRALLDWLTPISLAFYLFVKLAKLP